MIPGFSNRFRKQLGHWTLHGVFNALPSLIIALGFLNLWNSPAAVAAMFAAITIYILIFAIATSLPGPLAEESHVLSRAIRLGAKIRTWIACLSLPLLPIGMTGLIFTPDFWCGLLAVSLLNWVARFPGMGAVELAVEDNGGGRGFLPVFATTMLEGFIISFLIVMISFFAVIVLQSRDRKRLIKAHR